ncbi:hypothetical protein Q73_14335 [Bacillus coahuilensis m2-6]|uniref:hypothetical protein n=1 Tax=Bacillus coahuilensis TaxID=408580 RepID=UPI0007504830|nr:hypothetical protein [Bacillus coahuilensis]KUP05010.1 hypothetical protein Q73_14335 [Bacillus coahuilensis m2-6]
MKQKFAVIISILFLSFSFNAVATADTDDARQEAAVLELLEANTDIYEYIQQEVEKSEILVADFEEKIALEFDETKKAELQSGLDSKIAELVGNLQVKAEQMTKVAIEEAAKYGIIAECEYIEVEIYGNTYLIDPLRIIDIA